MSIRVCLQIILILLLNSNIFGHQYRWHELSWSKSNKSLCHVFYWHKAKAKATYNYMLPYTYIELSRALCILSFKYNIINNDKLAKLLQFLVCRKHAQVMNLGSLSHETSTTRLLLCILTLKLHLYKYKHDGNVGFLLL